MNKLFTHEQLIRFSHCDPAGIVYYPWFFDMTHATKEDWFLHGLGYSHADLVRNRRIGTPTVDIQCEFYKPLEMGETVRYELRVLKVGNSSVQLSITGVKDGVAHLKIVQTIAFMSLETRRAIPIPDDLRPRIEEYLVA